MLHLDNINAFYGEAMVLRSVSLMVKEGAFVSLIGRNGAGKTTTVRAIFQAVRQTEGRIAFHGRNLSGYANHAIAHLGIALVPEGRHIFPNLTVAENLTVAAKPGRWTARRIYDLLPALAPLKHRMGQYLSGGEQQMLAIARALMMQPTLIILDEATEGLAPIMQTTIWQTLATLKAEGLAGLIIDKNISALANLCSEHILIADGVSHPAISSHQLTSDTALQRRYLGV